MLISMNWIQDYVNLDGINLKELLNRFTVSTAEIEDVYYKGSEISGIVVGHILSVEAHPKSEKLSLLQVDAGDRVYDCVCGAPNVAVGIKTPFAKVGGATLEGEIKAATIAGNLSEGMCCSERELGVSDDHTGIMILDSEAIIGEDIKRVIPIEDTVFEVDNKSLTNRPDLWGHYGIAREFAALTGRPLTPLPQTEAVYQGSEMIPVNIDRPELCYRYSCLRISNVTRQNSLPIVKIRLYYCGMRSINFITDLTNYIMLEIGQPLHAFDASKISGINVKCFDSERTFVTLDKNPRNIDSNTLMICNEDTPVAIAGIMGGLDSEIEADTTELVLEAACFDAICIRKSATRLNLRTDASSRYEKSLDPEMTVMAVRRFLNLMSIYDTEAIATSILSDVYPFHYPQITIELDKKYVDKYSGIDIPAKQINDTLVSLGFGVSQAEDEFTVSVPTWRATKDVSLKADLIEELTRIYGYDNFVVKSSRSLLRPVRDSAVRTNDSLFKDILVLSHNLHEVHTYIWCDERKYSDLGLETEANVTVINGAADNNILRNSLLPSLLIAVSENKSFADSYGMFEIGKAFLGIDQNGLCDERRFLGIALFSKGDSEEAMFYKAVEIVNDLMNQSKRIKPIYKKIDPLHSWQHPKNTSGIYTGEVQIGTLCALHPYNSELLDKNGAAVCIEINMELLDTIEANPLSFVEPSRFPSIDYDLTVRLDEDTWINKVQSIIVSQDMLDLVSWKVADIYRGEHGVNITIRLSFSSMERTLARQDVQVSVDQLVEAWKNQGIELS